MSLKKQHEISRLSCLIKTICSDNIDVLIDFGSGLGYLSELLYKENAYKIIGIDFDIQRVQTSRERQGIAYPSSKNDVIFKEHFITEASKEFISHEVNTHFPEIQDPRLAIIGLHSCADLTINSMKLFFTMENVQKLIIMPCCYHKLEIRTEPNKIGFKNFPLSNVLKTAKAKRTAFNGFNRPFLRLACQQTSASWMKLTEKEHYDHGVDMFFRGVAEAIIKDDEMVIKSKRKKLLNQLDFEELISVYELHSRKNTEQIDWTEDHKNRFLKIMEKYPNGPKLAEGLTCLQTSMQELCENVVLYDRLCYMEEQAAEINLKISVKFEKIMDEVVSPRGYVLISQKL
ncbi:probable methyltransferase-like protein 25 [Episyrphus balteatus]|uniref:probable methyltransferase-like protein 25 n=1 Tax=Episyrphus balteatus TaxID=286459 RepID=UPI00248529B1|nr:probable methyltransferase-like protein 25 [Episyrphus balteatus]